MLERTRHMARRKLPKIVDADREAAEQQIREQSKRIDFYVTEYSVELLTQKMDRGDFVIPPYQRNFTWEEERKSRFIESVVMGLPIPFLFFWEMPESGKLEVVDGSQRLRTLHEFILGGSSLTTLEVLDRMSGFTFADLSVSRQRKINNRPIRGIVLHENADEQARFEMFERINTGSKIAKPTEVRRGALAGPFMDLVIELSDNELFASLAPMSKARLDQRGRDELVTRFFAYGDGLDGYKDRPSEFLFNYSKKMNAAFVEDASLAATYRQRFVSTMEFVEQHFPDGFRKTPKGRATPRARFEAIAIGSYLALNEDPTINEPGRVGDLTEWLKGEEFKKATGSDGANAIAKLRFRTDLVKTKLLA